MSYRLQFLLLLLLGSVDAPNARKRQIKVESTDGAFRLQYGVDDDEKEEEEEWHQSCTARP